MKVFENKNIFVTLKQKRLTINTPTGSCKTIKEDNCWLWL